jgi:2-octaprenyl-3-methyl-6-methoxy-1,4-benzoquinol hydroxylase
MSKHDVIVVGAGVVGSSAALMCARQGLSVAIVEAHSPKPWQQDKPDLRVYALALDNQQLLEHLDVWAEIQSKRIAPYRAMTVFDEVDGRPLQFKASDLGRDVLGYIVENNLLVDTLWQKVQQEKNITTYCPDKIESLHNQEKDVIVGLQSGKQLSSQIVLGADGALSKVRSLLEIKTDTHDYHQQGIVAYVKTELSHQNTAWQRFLSTGPLAFLPISETLCSIVWTLPTERAEQLMHVSPELFCSALDSAFAGTLGKTELTSERAAFPLNRQLAKTMMQDRTLLLGDAAHAVHPLAGQGVNLGLRDVADLQKSIEKSKNTGVGLLDIKILSHWATLRYSENAMAAYAFENINRVFSNDNFALSLIRGSLLGLGNKITPLKNALAKFAAGI